MKIYILRELLVRVSLLGQEFNEITNLASCAKGTDSLLFPGCNTEKINLAHQSFPKSFKSCSGTLCRHAQRTPPEGNSYAFSGRASLHFGASLHFEYANIR